jgi:putative inorganic carbon (HCO3(-)) transporter
LIINDGVSASMAGRLEIWSRGWYMVQDFPFTGIGMGLHEKMIEVMYPYFINPIPLAHAHNLFLQVAVDLGIPGLIAWLGILVNVILACITLIRSREPLLRAAGAGLLASNVALCVHGLTDAVTWGMVRTAPLVWALWGLAIGAALLCKPPAGPASEPSHPAGDS